MVEQEPVGQEPRKSAVALETRLRELREFVIKTMLPVAIPTVLFVGGLSDGASTAIQMINLLPDPAKETVQKQSDLERRLVVDALVVGTGGGLLLVLPLYFAGLFRRSESYTIIVRDAKQQAAEMSSFIEKALGNEQ